MTEITSITRVRDGGRAAIAGFLYQLVGVLGFQALAYECQSDPVDPVQHELSTLVQRTRAAVAVFHERFDQDALIELLPSLTSSADDGQALGSWALVQLKFSLNGAQSAINSRDFRKIEEAFERGEERAKQRGVTVQDKYVVTNRSVSEAFQEWARQRGIVTVQRESLEGWLERLRRFGRQFGCTGEEIESNLGSIVFKIMRQTAEGRDEQVTEQDMIEAFTDNREALPLALQSVFERTVDELPRKRDNLGLVTGYRPLRRDIVDQIAKEVTSERRALIFLNGDGGCGKTVALWQWLSEAKGESSALAFVSLLPAVNVTSTCITKEICRWGKYGSLHRRQRESAKESIGRLALANPSLSPPIFHLGVDGADEVIDIERGNQLEEVLQWFWEEDQKALQENRAPIAVLVVTCRSDKEIRKWLHLDWSGHYSGQTPPSLWVDEFSDDELQRIAEMTLSKQLASRIIWGLSAGQLGVSKGLQTEVGLFADSLDSYSGGAEDEAIKALRHPAMWFSFSVRLSEKQQHEVLSGDEAALSCLANWYVQWFSSRTSYRDSQNLARHLELVLPHIAAHTCPNSEALGIATKKEWERLAYSAADLGVYQAQWLFDEALSAGLIEQVGRKEWRWRHRFVARYLAEKEDCAHG